MKIKFLEKSPPWILYLLSAILLTFASLGLERVGFIEPCDRWGCDGNTIEAEATLVRGWPAAMLPVRYPGDPIVSLQLVCLAVALNIIFYLAPVLVGASFLRCLRRRIDKSGG